MTTDLEAIVLGIAMQVPPTIATAELSRLEAADFTDWRAATVFDLMTRAELPALHPASLIGHALSTGAVSGEHRLSQVSRWLANAYSCPVPVVALPFHVDLLIEAAYRRTVAAFATQLHQAHKSSSIDTVDALVRAGLLRLNNHRNRFRPQSTEVAA